MPSNISPVLKILKINILALLAFPLLLISIASKLIMKAFEKTLVFMGVAAAIFILFQLNIIINSWGGFFENLALIIGLLVFFGGIIALIFIIPILLGSIALAAFSFISIIVNAILAILFEISYAGYSKLYDICKCDYNDLSDECQSKYPTFACVFWHLLRAFNFLIIKLFSFTWPLSIVVCVGFIGYSIYFVSSKVQNTFGIGIFAYLKLFPLIQTVFAVLYFLVLVIGIAIIILSLGAEWSEWGQMLSLSTQDYDSYIQMQLSEIEPNFLDNSFEEGKNAQRCQQYINTLEELINDFEDLKQQVDAAMCIKHDPVIAYKFSEYVNLLNELSKQLSSKSNINPKIFELKFIPQIERASRLSKDIIKDTLRIINKNVSSANKAQKVFDFFEGCSTEEELKKRYKALCKVYHPDVGGHEETFKLLQNQFEEKMKAVKV